MQIQNWLLQIGLKKDDRACLSVLKKRFISHAFHSRGSVTGLFKEFLFHNLSLYSQANYINYHVKWTSKQKSFCIFPYPRKQFDKCQPSNVFQRCSVKFV